MSNSGVERYFGEYILPPRGFIYNDIKREIEIARHGKDSGNFLSALGLLCYTEFMGAIYLKGKKSTSKTYFTTFLRSMGKPYQQLLDQGTDVYKIFRCGMAHTYFPQNCSILMLNNKQPAGIIVNSDGRCLFIVEKYFEDFMDACRRLYTRIAFEEPMVIKGNLPYLPST